MTKIDHLVDFALQIEPSDENEALLGQNSKAITLVFCPKMTKIEID